MTVRKRREYRRAVEIDAIDADTDGILADAGDVCAVDEQRVVSPESLAPDASKE